MKFEDIEFEKWQNFSGVRYSSETVFPNGFVVYVFFTENCPANTYSVAIHNREKNNEHNWSILHSLFLDKKLDFITSDEVEKILQEVENL